MFDVEFNHDGIKMHETFNISDERAKRIYSIMFYETISTFIIAGDLFEDPFNDSPRNLITKSGKLERVLKKINNNQEKYYVLASYFIEATKIEHVLEKFAKSRLITKLSFDTNHTDKTRALIVDILKSLGDEIFKDLDNIIEKIKVSNDDFNIFMALLDHDDPDQYIEDAVQGILHLGDDKKDSSDE